MSEITNIVTFVADPQFNLDSTENNLLRKKIEYLELILSVHKDIIAEKDIKINNLKAHIEYLQEMRNYDME